MTATPDPYVRPSRRRTLPPPPEYALVTLDGLTAGVQEWLEDDFLPEGVFKLTVGREGVGKGLYGAWSSSRLTNRSLNVGVFGFEDSLTIQTVPRYRAA